MLKALRGGGGDLDYISLPLGTVLLHRQNTLTLFRLDGRPIKGDGESKGVPYEAGRLHTQEGQGQAAILPHRFDVCNIAHKGAGSLPLFQRQLDENKVPHLKEKIRLKNNYKREQPRQLTAYKCDR